MIGSLGGPELLLILILALIVFGPRKLPEIGKSLGKMMVEFRRAGNDFKRTIEEEVDAEKLKAELQMPPLLSAPDVATVPDAGAAPPSAAPTSEPGPAGPPPTAADASRPAESAPAPAPGEAPASQSR